MIRPYIYIFSLFLVLISCKEPNTICSFDDLEDMSDLNEGFIIDCFTYKNHDIEKIVLNDEEIFPLDDIAFTECGYYHMEIYWDSRGKECSEIIRFVILDDERGQAEWGLKPWVPAEPEYSNPGEETITFIHPAKVPDGMDMPVVIMIGDEINSSSLMLKAAIGEQNFNIKKGIGSCQIPTEDQTNTSVAIGNKSYSISSGKITDSPIVLNGNLQENMNIPENSYISINDDLIIPEGITLSIAAGTFVAVAPNVNITNEGSLLISGLNTNPVTITCSNPNKYWGGFIGTSANNSITASYAIFCRSGIHTGENYDYGHAKRQALFYCENGDIEVDHCYIIDNIGQIFYPKSAHVSIKNSLIQRAKTGGQMNYSQITIDNTIFTDFPDDTYEYQDQDNDGLYLSGSDATISNSVFMFAKDDGLDSGGNEGGEILLTNCRFESVFHEGAALSSQGTVTKKHTFNSCTFSNCGQGLELGFSGINHEVVVDSCSFIENGIGIRYGDNYAWTHKGNISVSNSISIDNYSRDIWNMLRENWSADTAKMTFDNVSVSHFVPMYPLLEIYE